MIFTIGFFCWPIRKKEINDEDIRILAGVVFQGEKSLKLDLLQVSCGKSLIPVATVG